MEKDIDLGPEAKAKIAIVDGKVQLSVSYEGKQASAGASAALDIDAFAKLLKDAIPGKIDDTVIDLLVTAMKMA